MKNEFDRIAGYELEKAELMRLTEIFNNRKKYEEKGAKLPKGIIFSGAAGTGKTLFAKVLAKVCGLKVFKIDLAEVTDNNEVCKLIKNAFDAAASCDGPAMVFFDEVDKVLPNSYEHYVTDRSKAALSQLLTLIDGMDSAGNIIFVATCNNYYSLPETLVRPGRIDKKIVFDLPDYQSRVAILTMYAQRTKCVFEMSMEEIAKLAKHFSCAALETLINECVLQSDDDGFVSRRLVEERFFEIETEDIPRPKEPTKDDIVMACRNIGAFVVAKAFDNGDCKLTVSYGTTGNAYFDNILSYYDSDYESWEKTDDIDDDDDDYDYDDDDDDDYDYDDDDYDYDDDDYDDDDDGYGNERCTSFSSKEELLNAVTVCLGGYAAEEIVLGKLYNNLMPDLHIVDEIIFHMAENGMFGLPRRFSSARERKLMYSDEWTNEFYQKVDDVIDTLYLKAKGIIGKNEGIIRNLIPILVEKESIEREDCESLLAQFGGLTY